MYDIEVEVLIVAKCIVNQGTVKNSFNDNKY